MAEISSYSEIDVGDYIWFNYPGAQHYHYCGGSGASRRQTVIQAGRDFVLAKCEETRTYSLIQGDLSGVFDQDPYEDEE